MMNRAESDLNESEATLRVLALIGPRGAGKTAVGKLLTHQLGWPFVDCDDVIESEAHCSIRDIFQQHGEPAFRDLESRVLARLTEGSPCVLATGGGVVERVENRQVLAKCQVVWLTAPADVLWHRMQADASTTERRPNLAGGGLEEVRQIVARRAPLYQACADFCVETTTRTPADVAEAIMGWVREFAKPPRTPRRY